MITRTVTLITATLAFALLCASRVHAQAVYAAEGPGTYVSIGASASLFNSDYGQRDLAGASAFLDAHLYRRIGTEAEARFLQYRSGDGLRQVTYLAGPKISTHPRTIRPYAKFLVGRGEFTFPLNTARGSYFVMAPGGGLDWRIHRSRFMIRAIDFEYQIWPGFTFGPLHPYGLATGISYRIF